MEMKSARQNYSDDEFSLVERESDQASLIDVADAESIENSTLNVNDVSTPSITTDDPPTPRLEETKRAMSMSPFVEHFDFQSTEKYVTENDVADPRFQEEKAASQNREDKEMEDNQSEEYTRASETAKEIYAMFEQALQLNAADRLMESHALIQETLDTIKKHEEVLESNSPTRTKLERLRLAIESNPEVLAMQKDVEHVHTVASHLKEKQGWVEVTDKRQIQTAYKEEQASPMHSIKVTGDVAADLFHVLTLINESDLLPTLIPINIQVTKLKQISKFRQLLHIRLKLPWPFDDRDLVIVSRGVDLLKDGHVIIVGYSVHSWDDVEIPPVASGCTRLDVHLFGSLITPISKEKTSITAFSSFDLKMNTLPPTLLNFFSRHLAFYGFEIFQRQASRLMGSVYEKRILNNPELYDEIETKSKEFFARLEAARNAPPQPALSPSHRLHRSTDSTEGVIKGRGRTPSPKFSPSVDLPKENTLVRQEQLLKEDAENSTQKPQELSEKAASYFTVDQEDSDMGGSCEEDDDFNVIMDQSPIKLEVNRKRNISDASDATMSSSSSAFTSETASNSPWTASLIAEYFNSANDHH